MKYLLELRTTISPTPSFFRRIHFLAASLRDLGGALADHEIVVSVGGGQPENYYRTQPWSNRYPLIWRPVDPEAYARLGYRAINRDRAAHLARGTFVMVVDADVIFLNDFSPLIDDLRADPHANRLFLQLLASPHRVATQLDRMKRYGVLGRFIPEFGRIIGQTQHDLFHVYSVDSHTIRVVKNMRRFSYPDNRELFPTAAFAVQRLPKPHALSRKQVGKARPQRPRRLQKTQVA